MPACERIPAVTFHNLLPAPQTAGANLPVRAVLSEVEAAVTAFGAAVLVAPPGTGKTSLLPLALADLLPGRVIVAEPRRIATRAAARRMASLLGERVGDRIGYSVRGERQVSKETVVEVVTTGLLVQRMQGDPGLEGVAAVVIDECHERHLDTDLALAFALDIRANLRDDLIVVATSATADSDRIASTMGGTSSPVPVIVARSPLYPVEIVWARAGQSVPLLADRRVNPALLDQVAALVRRALVEHEGDVLVFLPGESEINAVARRLHGAVAILPLLGRQSAADQDRVLQPGAQRRVVLSTAVAESSLTVPGVRIVVDAGLSREPRTDQGRGLSSLITTRVSRASAEQRAGRAGRLGPGVVYRSWSEADHVHLADHAEPEVAIADLSGFALELARWGSPRGAGLALVDQPATRAMEVAERTLRTLEAVDLHGRITARGRQIGAIGIQPRLARALLDGAAAIGAHRACELVAILSAEGLVGAGQSDDLAANWRRLRSNTADQAATGRWREETNRLSRALDRTAIARSASRDRLSDDAAAGLVVGLAFPERLGRSREVGGTRYLMAGGTGAALAPSSTLRNAEWLAIAVADRSPGAVDARVRLAATIDESSALKLAASLRAGDDVISWDDGELRVRRIDRLGAIMLAERPLPDADPAQIAAALRHAMVRDGLSMLNWSAAAQQYRDRLDFCRRNLGAPWPDVSDAALLAGLDSWLTEDLTGVRRTSDLARINVVKALKRLLPWPDAARFDELAPEWVQVPSGSRVRLDYGHAEPVLAVRIQELFGWPRVPRIADGRVEVVLHLLSPAGRTAAVTSDLASFWAQGYPQVRSELRGRYPRHPWPADPTVAQPTKRAKPRR